MKEPNLIEKAFILKKTPIFADINLDHLLAIAEKLDAISVPKDHTLIKAGMIPQFFYVILQGTFEKRFNDKTPSRVFSPGQILGEVALFKGEPYPYEVISLSSGFVLALTIKHLSSILVECPSVGIELLKGLALKVD